MARRKVATPPVKQADPTLIPQHNPAPFDFAKVVDGCAVEGCKAKREGFITAIRPTTEPVGHLWFAPICRKHCHRYYAHVVLHYRYIAQQYKRDYVKMARVFNTTPDRVKELERELQGRTSHA